MEIQTADHKGADSARSLPISPFTSSCLIQMGKGSLLAPMFSTDKHPVPGWDVSVQPWTTRGALNRKHSGKRKPALQLSSSLLQSSGAGLYQLCHMPCPQATVRDSTYLRATHPPRCFSWCCSSRQATVRFRALTLISSRAWQLCDPITVIRSLWWSSLVLGSCKMSSNRHHSHQRMLWQAKLGSVGSFLKYILAAWWETGPACKTQEPGKGLFGGENKQQAWV